MSSSPILTRSLAGLLFTLGVAGWGLTDRFRALRTRSTLSPLAYRKGREPCEG
jgi:hypothetical protein